MTLAKENQSNFEEYLNSNTNVNPGLDLTVTVLTTGFWPSYKSFDLNLPLEMVHILSSILESSDTCNSFFQFEVRPYLVLGEINFYLGEK